VPETLGANIAVEGDLDEVVLRKILKLLNIEVENAYGKKGKDNLRVNIKRYNKAAAAFRRVVLVDLNQEADCPPPLISSWLPHRNPNLQLRVAVRAIEAWLLADRSEIASFLKVTISRIPQSPENEANPKITLINIARHSRSRIIREDIVPKTYGTANQGPGYTSQLIEYSWSFWDPKRAAQNAPSLERCLRSLSIWKQSQLVP
jgi:hypothetical protein